jgi:2-haloalkanoic acid dehalogenase type II
MSKITTVIFDVYETLAYNSSALWVETFRAICRTQALLVDPVSLYRDWKELEVGFRRNRLNLEEPEKGPPFKSYETAWRDCFVGAFGKLSLTGDPAAAARKAIADMGVRDPYPDAVEALPEIQARWKTGVLSNADEGYLYPLLERIGWKFPVVLSSEEVGAYKPLPAAFERVLDDLGVGAGEAVYVGDTLYDDILGSRGVGMRSAWINRYGASRDSLMPAPDFEIHSLAELPALLEAAY